MTVQFKNVSKRFGTTEAVRALNLSLEQGGIVAVMGPSGCGKTTILQMLAGITAPTVGTVRSSGRGIAYAFQEPRLLPWRTALENICLARAASTPPPTRSAHAWLDAVGLSDCADRFPEELSGGMRQRVSLARALYCDSDLLLLDEPFQGLDHDSKQRIWALIREVRSRTHMLTLIVTHDREEAEALADTIITFDTAPASTYRTESVNH